VEGNMFRIVWLALVCSPFIAAQTVSSEGAPAETSGTFGHYVAVGLVGGVARDAASGKPVAQAQVTAHNLAKDTDAATVTGADGIFTFTNL
jgi:hypothetical protein